MPPLPRLLRSLAPLRRHYHDTVLDHYHNPRNVGSFPKTTKNIGTGLVGAPACGDVMKLQIQVDEKTGKKIHLLSCDTDGEGR